TITFGRLGRGHDPLNNGFTNQNPTIGKIDVFPLQAIDLSGTQARKEPNNVVVAEITAYLSQKLLHFLQRERLYVGLIYLECFDAVKRDAKLKTVSSVLKNHFEWCHDVVNPVI